MSGFGISLPGFGLDPFGDPIPPPTLPFHLYLTSVTFSLQASLPVLVASLMVSSFSPEVTLEAELEEWEATLQTYSPIPVLSSLQSDLGSLTVTLD